MGICYSPDGKTIASCSCDKTIKLWNSKDGKKITTYLRHQVLEKRIFKGHQGTVFRIC